MENFFNLLGFFEKKSQIHPFKFFQIKIFSTPSKYSDYATAIHESNGQIKPMQINSNRPKKLPLFCFYFNNNIFIFHSNHSKAHMPDFAKIKLLLHISHYSNKSLWWANFVWLICNFLLIWKKFWNHVSTIREIVSREKLLWIIMIVSVLLGSLKVDWG